MRGTREEERKGASRDRCDRKCKGSRRKRRVWEVAEEDDTGTKAQYGQGEKEEPLI